MILSQSSLSLQLLWVAVWGLVVFVSYYVVIRLLDVLPIGDDQRGKIERLQPFVGLLLAFVFALYSVESLFSHTKEVLPYARLLVLVAFFVGGFSFLKEFFGGIAIRSEQSLSLGDHVRIGTARGRVLTFAARGIALETAEGDTIFVPYSKAAHQEITRTRAAERGASTTFSVPLGQSNFVDLKRRIERHALLHHWTSVARSPEVALQDGQVEVTLFVLSLEHAPLVKASVLRAISTDQNQ